MIRTKYLFNAIAMYALCIFGIQEARAQMVYATNDNVVILDCGPDSGFPQGAVSSSKGQKTIQNPSNSGSNSSNNTDGTINQAVYIKLQIANANEKGTDGKDITANWATAYTTCTAKNTNGESGWRLPTQRESQLIWIFKTALESYSFFTSFTGDYWTGTESTTSDYSWYICIKDNDNNDGYSPDNTLKSTQKYIRCVKELD